MSGLLGLMLLSGCAPEGPAGPAPINVTEYKKMGPRDRTRHSDSVIVQLNLARTHNPELTVAHRLQSLELVKQITRQDYSLLDENSLSDLATLLRDTKTPTKLKQQVLRFLLLQNYRDLAAYIIPLLEKLKEDPELRTLVLNYLKNNPNSQMLAGIVRTWAAEGEITGTGEQSYRKAIKQISGRDWDVTLLDEMNSPSFEASGEAMEILRRRLKSATLRRKILAIKPRSDTIRALQEFTEVFDYFPASSEELITASIIYKVRGDMLPDAAKMCLDWTKNYKYRFNIRDFHLVSRLARDPLRSNLKQTKLILTIGRTLKTRKHIHHKPTAAGAVDDYKDSFWLHVDQLTTADLWNIYLLNEMLSRPRTQKYLKLLAEGDFADPNSVWGGLVFYENGQAEASLYRSSKETGNNLIYQPTGRLITDGRDSLCRFVGHFEKINNAERAGPTAGELQSAKKANYYGLVLTRTGRNSFCAHYYNPAGIVVSLGKFPLR